MFGDLRMHLIKVTGTTFEGKVHKEQYVFGNLLQ
jgi:hypothetical protein